MFDTVRARRAGGGPLLGAWLSLREPLVAEFVSSTGYDYVGIDGQHGTLDDAAVLEHVRACVAGGRALPLVRVAANDAGLIGRALDAGAAGVVVPMVETPDDAVAAVAACRYAPAGRRSFGPVTAGTRYGPSYTTGSDGAVSVVVMVETATGLENVEQIARTPGVHAVYVGPADLARTLGLPPALDSAEPVFTAALERVVAACHDAGVLAGVHANRSLAADRLRQGFDMVTVAHDVPTVFGALGDALRAGRRPAR